MLQVIPYNISKTHHISSKSDFDSDFVNFLEFADEIANRTDVISIVLSSFTISLVYDNLSEIIRIRPTNITCGMRIRSYVEGAILCVHRILLQNENNNCCALISSYIFSILMFMFPNFFLNIFSIFIILNKFEIIRNTCKNMSQNSTNVVRVLYKIVPFLYSLIMEFGFSTKCL